MHDSDPSWKRRARQWSTLALTPYLVILLIGCSVLLASVSPCGHDRACLRRIQADFAWLRAAQSRFRAEHGRWPRSISDLLTQTAEEGREKRLGSLERRQFLDPYSGEPYLVRRAEDGSLIFVSLGADQALGGVGTDEDIHSKADRR